MNLSKEFLNSKTGQQFLKWWKNHRDAGYATKMRGAYEDEHYAIPPMIACNVDRYMAEFCGDHNLEERSRFDYPARDYERWAKEQKQADDGVKRFAAAHNGREIPTREEMIQAFEDAKVILRKKLEVRKQDLPPASKSEGQIERELHAFQQKRTLG